MCPLPKPWSLEMITKIKTITRFFTSFQTFPVEELLFSRPVILPRIVVSLMCIKIRSITIHSPQLDLSVISTWYNEWHGRMESNPVDTTVMTLTSYENICQCWPLSNINISILGICFSFLNYKSYSCTCTCTCTCTCRCLWCFKRF